MTSVFALSTALGITPNAVQRRLRAGKIKDAVKVGRRWQIPERRLWEAYAERANPYFQARRAMPLSVHYPYPQARYRFAYQFEYHARLDFSDGSHRYVQDYSFNHVTQLGQPKPTSSRLWGRLRSEVSDRYLGNFEEYADTGAVRVKLTAAKIVRIQRLP